MKGKNRFRIQDRNGTSIHDAYYNRSHPQDGASCKQCHALFHHKHWSFVDSQTQGTTSDKSQGTVLCPACAKIADKHASGVVTLRGEFLSQHREEILNLIHNEERRAMGLNPLERIIEIAALSDGFQVTTTHEKLAQRIGRSLHKAFSGQVAYRWMPQDKMARVDWSRN